jgi:hypothetical protein
VLFVQDAHHDHVGGSAVTQSVPAEQPFAREPAFFETADHTCVVLISHSVDSPQAEVFEGVRQQSPDGPRAVAAAPDVFLTDAQMNFRPAL